MARETGHGIRYERDMYAPVKAYLQSQGWEVRAEVEGCDAAALRGGKLLMAELKLALNLDVILQAVERQKTADVVYVAVPRKERTMRTRRWRDTLELLKRLNLGLLAVSVRGGAADVEEFVEPRETGEAPRGRAVRRRIRAVRELNGRTGDFNTGGVRGLKLVTAYREAALRLAARLASAGPMSAKQLKPEGEKARGTYTILRDNHYGWFRPLGRGMFGVTDLGREALKTYGEVLDSACRAEADEEEVFAGTVED